MFRQASAIHRIVLGQLRAFKGELALGGLCLLGTSAMTLLEPWPLKIAVDHLLLAKPLPPGFAFLSGLLQAEALTALAALAGVVVLMAFATGFFTYGQQFITSRIGHRLVFSLRGELFDHLQRLSLSYHNRARTGELMSKITGDTNTLRDVYSEYLLIQVSHALTVGGMVAVMLWIDWRLALVVLATFPVLFTALFRVLRRVRASARRQRSNEGKLASRLVEMLRAVSLVQAFGRERYERERFDEENSQSMAESIRAARMEAAGTRLIDVVTAVGRATVLVFGGLRALEGHMSPGDLLVFLSYVAALYRPVRAMARLSTRMAKASVSVERINAILDTVPEIEDAPDAIEARGLRGDIRFEEVSFAYEPGKNVLDCVSFDIPAGKWVALVGPSGAGKSTIANLLIRLYDAGGGRILIDAVDVRRYRRESLRREVGVVLQDSLLFGASIRENIAYGMPEASDEDIERAARQVHAHDFIAALPGGYDHVLGERGATLSGGQRQRLCLARALVKRTAILLMDEPTSAVDEESATLIHDALRSVQAGKTLLLVTHQLRSAQDADLILVLKDGRIVEQGTHDELAARGTHYTALFQLQGPARPTVRSA